MEKIKGIKNSKINNKNSESKSNKVKKAIQTLVLWALAFIAVESNNPNISHAEWNDFNVEQEENNFYIDYKVKFSKELIIFMEDDSKENYDSLIKKIDETIRDCFLDQENILKTYNMTEEELIQSMSVWKLSVEIIKSNLKK